MENDNLENFSEASGSLEYKSDNRSIFELRDEIDNLKKDYGKLKKSLAALLKEKKHYDGMKNSLTFLWDIELAKKNTHRKEIDILKEEIKFLKLAAKDPAPITMQEIRETARNSLIKKMAYPARLFFLWRRTRIPRALGGSSYARVIERWQKEGRAGVETLIKNSGASNYIQGNAYTALARFLQSQKNMTDMVWAAEKAYEVNPRLFRAKWLAFRLGDAGYWADAEAMLELCRDKVPFSPTEMRQFEMITLEAEVERKLEYGRSGSAGQYAGSGQKGNDAGKKNLEKMERYFVEVCKLRGPAKCAEEVKKSFNKKLGSAILIRLSRTVRSSAPDCEFPLVREAFKLNKNSNILCAFFWSAQRSRKYLEAARMIGLLESRLNLWSSGELVATYNKMKSSMTSNLLLLDLVVKNRRDLYKEQAPKRICYVLHNSLPYSSGGYATRAYGITSSLKRLGYDVCVVTRPGYPRDIAEELENEDVPEVWEDPEGVPYHRLFEPYRNHCDMKQYITLSADRLEEKFRELRPELVMSASNHITGLPALIAARRLGIPFIYEVRGLWEITRLSREKKFRDSPAFHVQRIFETQICKKANLVFTLTNQLKQELVDRGAPEDRIMVAPNACDPERFVPTAKDPEILKLHNIPADVPVIGYVGTFVIYEGLEELAEACGALKRRGRDFRLLLVGNENATGTGKGEITEGIERIARENGFEDWLIMPGRVPHEEARKYYSVIDIAPFPRKPWPVCEIVSPMKPMEAMAMEKAVIVSSVGALKDMVSPEKTGLIFEKGNYADLAAKLEYLLDNPELRKTLGQNAREFIRAERTWERTGMVMSEWIEKILADYTGTRQEEIAEEELEEPMQENQEVEMASEQEEVLP